MLLVFFWKSMYSRKKEAKNTSELKPWAQIVTEGNSISLIGKAVVVAVVITKII
jgi:hypothetical protein